MFTKILGVEFAKPTPNTKKKKTNYVKITGYGATVSGVASALAIKAKNPKLHKNLAYLAGLLTLTHIGLIEWYNHKFKTNKKRGH